jgi:hypothetical protein
MPRLHPPEFRRRAVELAIQRDETGSRLQPLSKTAGELGISESCLRNWVRQGRTFADHHLRGDMGPRLLPGPNSGNTKSTPGTQTGDQLTLESAASFDVKSLVDGLVRDPHGLIIDEIDPQAVGDLLRAPALHPTAIPTMWLVTALPLRALRP